MVAERRFAAERHRLGWWPLVGNGASEYAIVGFCVVSKRKKITSRNSLANSGNLKLGDLANV